MLIDQPSPQKKSSFSMTFREGPNKLGFFVPFQLISSNFNEQIIFVGSVYNEGKSRSFTGVFDLNVLTPFSMVTMTEAINDTNLLLKVTITNNAEFELRDIYLEITPTPNFIFKESCLKIADVMEPNGINSSVFEIERQGNEILNATEIGNLKVKFMLNSSKYEYNHFTPIITEAISKRNSPILFKWMNYDDVQSVLQGFTVDLEVTNSCNEERSFVIQIATDTTNLMPSGISSFNVEKLPSKAKTTLQVNLMALKRGFFVFPRIFVQGLPEGDFTVEIQNGIMATD
ncbi:hypothetical protein TVAG_491180 [Trichomonas vaginalis G3]|uniref:Trafficking protein particle complex subunit 13 C-terminal domain-containing protein n=1 Tax=Trichomonas vaginalis (strain ATCC PRA-98 / G3) TaxID=412133 RepID=A2E061_TRIV3|nr:trafficking protein particle complex subunit 10 (TRAPPC10) family [Trichomonas vaginalis G3]EAY13980.1 hypothetical protein TVAG_491180 [Trichomonas vaginalis G3]KAI5551805.1 trafficking protein particle complex subunit 10 (TRAPPC10) family [Trichomonas vaginalis G3]|eukprot:XP_001326203.1 hypothetical protein [Trichomonas vaginalis G3]